MSLVPDLLHELVEHTAARAPDALALTHARSLCYAELADEIAACAGGLLCGGLRATDRVGVYLPKCIEAVVPLFGAARSGGVFVPINPVLKPRQVQHILRDCNVRVLFTSADRLELLAPQLEACPDLRQVVLVDADDTRSSGPQGLRVRRYGELLTDGRGAPTNARRRIDTDLGAILYTSGSTGRPKGVVLSHRNLVAGARSVASYLGNTEQDRILSVLTLSFDAGLSQLTTAFSVGASVALLEYLLPRDVIRAAAEHQITGLAGVPPLWVQLAELDWPAEAVENLRYITNTGGAMPTAVTAKLRTMLTRTSVYLMYGLTEAFRSTYLPPDEIDRRPDSIGKAIPNAEILVVREDGTRCEPGEPGELVHRGALVSLGYWNDPERTAERFRPAPGQSAALPHPEFAVWSGDTVRMDEDGYLYFVGRQDEMIKTSGYRVSPTEIEEVLFATGVVREAAAIGIPHARLGQAIIAVVVPAEEALDDVALLAACRRELPNYMVPARVVTQNTLPRNPNGKVDRRAIARALGASPELETSE